jgi:hypothetical protein
MVFRRVLMILQVRYHSEWGITATWLALGGAGARLLRVALP